MSDDYVDPADDLAIDRAYDEVDRVVLEQVPGHKPTIVLDDFGGTVFCSCGMASPELTRPEHAVQAWEDHKRQVCVQVASG